MFLQIWSISLKINKDSFIIYQGRNNATKHKLNVVSQIKFTLATANWMFWLINISPVFHATQSLPCWYFLFLAAVERIENKEVCLK